MMKKCCYKTYLMPVKGTILSFRGFDGWAIFLRLVCFFQGFIYLPPSVNNNFISRGYLARMPVKHMVIRFKDIHAFDNNKTMKIIYIMYRAGEVSVHRACCERAIQPYSLGEGGTMYPGSRPAGFTTRVFTHSLDVN